MRTVLRIWAFALTAYVGIISAPLYAQTDVSKLTIEALVSRTLKDNPELEFYEQELAAAKGGLRSSDLLENPELETAIGRKRDLSREGTAWSVSVVQAFEYPGRLFLRKAIANRQVALAELGLERFEAALAAEARKTAYALLAAQQIAEAAREVSSRGQELVSVLVQREPAGINPLLETRIIEANVVSLQKRAIDAEGEVQEARFELNKLTGNPLSHPVEIVATDLPLGPIASLEELVASAMDSNFELRMKAEELKAQGFRVELAKNERYPGIKVGPFYSEERAEERERVAGLGISVPLPLWNRNAGTIEAERAREAQAKTSLLLAQRDVERTVRGHALSYERRLREIRRWRPRFVDELREAAELGDRHYRLGAIPVSTYVELQTQYIDGLEAILNVQREALESLGALEAATGLSLMSRKERES